FRVTVSKALGSLFKLQFSGVVQRKSPESLSQNMLVGAKPEVSVRSPVLYLLVSRTFNGGVAIFANVPLRLPYVSTGNDWPSSWNPPTGVTFSSPSSAVVPVTTSL